MVQDMQEPVYCMGNHNLPMRMENRSVQHPITELLHTALSEQQTVAMQRTRISHGSRRIADTAGNHRGHRQLGPQLAHQSRMLL